MTGGKNIKLWVKILTATGLLLCLSVIYLHWQLNPKQMFSNREIAVLAAPEMAQEELGEEESLADNVVKQSFNLLILGIDAWNDEKSRTDLIMLANVNTESKKINIVSIPRDTRVNIPNVGYTKINHAHILGEIKGGNKMGTSYSLQAVSNLFNTDINYYIKVDFQGLKNFIDLLGGVEIELAQPLYLSFANITLPAQKQVIDGELAIEFVRERYSLPEGDFGRQKNHYLLLKAISNKLLEPKTIRKAPQLLKQAKEQLVDTNFTEIELLSLALMFQGLADDHISYTQISGYGEQHFDPLVKSNLYYWIPDKEEISSISERVFNN